ncbi:MAG: SDR family oxidoreductase, partial [Acidimicrobiales bacterium]
DELHQTATISDGTWAALRRSFPPAEIVELILVAGQYRMLSTLANAAGVDASLEPGPTVPTRPAPFAMDNELLGLRDAVALITGGARSIGRGCALLLARAGCHVVVADIADGEAAVAEIEALGRTAAYERGDMRSKTDIQRIVDATIARFGRLDVAVNTVGSTKGPKPFLDIDIEAWDDVVTQNLSTTVLSTQVEALAMIKLGIRGRIINIASLSGVAAAPNAAGYGAANAGVIHMTRSAALELARYGIRVNCIVPGTHYTEAVHEALVRDPQIAEWVRMTGEACPLGRIGEVWETAGVAVFLASKLSSFVTGEEIVSDGGTLHTTARPPIGMATEADAVLRLRTGTP